MRAWISIARMNLKNHKKLSNITLTTIVFGSVLFLVLSSFLVGVQKISENLITTGYNLQEIQISTVDSLENNLIDKVKSLENVVDVNVGYILIPVEIITITMDGKQIKSPYLYGSDTSYSSFSAQKIITTYGELISPVIYGRDFNDHDRKAVLIDENFAYVFGFSNLEDVIGEKISIQIGNMLIEDITVVGVFGYELGSLNRRKKDTMSHSERQDFFNRECNIAPFLLSSDIINEFASSRELEFIEVGQFSINVFVNEIGNVLETSDEIVEITNVEVWNQMRFILIRLETIKNIAIFLLFVGAIVLIVSLVTIATTLTEKIRKQRKLVEIMQKIGFTGKDIKMIYLFENIFLILKASVIFVSISFVASIFLDMLLLPAYTEITTLGKFLFLLDIRVVLIYVSLMLFIVVLITIAVNKNQLKGKTPYEIV